MDVTCPRCQTDYEFDDALVSERGTTVKCTNCGHQFRVFRPRAGNAQPAAAQESWRIDRRDGQVLELKSLVELQRAIRAGRVGRQDLLRRGDGAPRRVGDIPELEPFFPAPRQEGSANTMPLPALGDRPVAPTPAWGRAIATPEPGSHLPAQAPIHTPPPHRPPSVPPPAHRPASVPPPRPPAPPPNTQRPLAPPPAAIPSAAAFEHPEQHTDQRISLDDLAAHEPITQRRPDVLPPPLTPSLAPPPIDVGGGSEPPGGMDALFATDQPPPRRKIGGWIAALVVLGGAALLGATVGKPYLRKLMAGTTSSASATNGGAGERLTRALQAGDRARDEGDFATARESYLTATGADDKSLAAWDGLCTAESELAVAHWVAALMQGSALERDQATSLGTAAARSCAHWSDIARASEDPKRIASDARAARALAAQGDGAGVRVYLPSHPGEPVFGALAALAEVTKSDASQIATAAKSTAPLLAKANLAGLTSPGELALVTSIYSLSGQPPRAQEALAELGKRAPRYMLLELLRGPANGADAGVGEAGAPAASTSSSAVASASPSSSAVGTSGTSNVGGGTVTSGGGTDDTSGDYRALNERAHKALASGDSAKAETLFRAALAQHSGDVDALYGLGQIARARGDRTGAINYFKQVLDTSAGFAPARLALADEQWAGGQQDDARKNYLLYLDRVSEGSGAERARSRTGLEKKPDPAPESP